MEDESDSGRQDTISDKGKIIEFVIKDKEEDKQLPSFVRAFDKFQKEGRLLLPANTTDESRALGDLLSTLRFLEQESRPQIAERVGLPSELLIFIEHGMIDPKKITGEEWKKIGTGYKIDDIDRIKKICGVEPNNVIRPDFSQ